jgi:hypothetical protein
MTAERLATALRAPAYRGLDRRTLSLHFASTLSGTSSAPAFTDAGRPVPNPLRLL